MGLTNVSETSTFEGMALGPNADGVFVIGGTKDVLYGGDMSGDSAGDGIALTGGSASDSHFALAVYGDDGGTAVASGWVSTGFFSYINHAAQAAGSAIALTGQVHIGANFTAGDNIAGVYGLVECDSAVTCNAHVFGGQFNVTLSSGTYSAGYRVAAVSLYANQSGATTNGTVTGLHFMNATSGFDAAMSFGTVAGDITGTGITVAAVGGSNSHKMRVYVGATLMYVPLYTS